LTGEETMPFTEEIRQAAEKLGKQLGIDPGVHEFVSLKEKIQHDAEVVDLEDRLFRLYQKLVDRQQNGEVLDRVELDEYYYLKRKVQDHPLIAARDNQLEIVKAFFAQTAQRMTSVLGIEYTTFAK
jgi:cell fate (sporulation/competence/biofilm development) regulator YlbF (YheA/YmcA/DUF963 family)